MRKFTIVCEYEEPNCIHTTFKSEGGAIPVKGEVILHSLYDDMFALIEDDAIKKRFESLFGGADEC